MMDCTHLSRVRSRIGLLPKNVLESLQVVMDLH